VALAYLLIPIPPIFFTIKFNSMKIKNMFAFAGLLGLALFTMAFVKKDATKTSADGQSFVEFLSYFEKTNLPYSIGLSDMLAYKDYRKNTGKRTISQQQKALPAHSPLANSSYLPEGRFGKMSRMGPPDIQPLARFYPNENMVAVIYSVQQRFGDGLHKQFNLMLYDLKGNILPKSKASQSYQLAFSSVENTGTCTIDANGHIWVNTYKNIWKENVAHEGFIGNELLDFKLSGTEVFKINTKTGLEPVKDYPITSRASLD
jgi:hypothetical protein